MCNTLIQAGIVDKKLPDKLRVISEFSPWKQSSDNVLKLFLETFKISKLCKLLIPSSTDKTLSDISSLFKLTYGTNLHRVWDTDMIENFNMSYTEISKYLQSYKKVDFPQGDAVCWANESQQIVKKVYETEVGSQLSYSYIYNNFHIVKDRLYRAGIRLANLLNEIYG